LFESAVEMPYTTASWFAAPEPLLDGKTPAERLAQAGSPDLALKAASRFVERLRR
jgi:hypothetical protein